MEAEEFVRLWHASFGPETKPPEACLSLGKLTVQDVGTELKACETRVEALQTRLRRELRALGFLRRVLAELEDRRTRTGGVTRRSFEGPGGESTHSFPQPRKGDLPVNLSRSCQDLRTSTHSDSSVHLARRGGVKSKDRLEQPPVDYSSSAAVPEGGRSDPKPQDKSPEAVNIETARGDAGKQTRGSVIRESLVQKVDGTDKCVSKAVNKRLIEQGKWWSSNSLESSQTLPIGRTRSVSYPPSCVQQGDNASLRSKTHKVRVYHTPPGPIPTIKLRRVVNDPEGVVPETPKRSPKHTEKEEKSHLSGEKQRVSSKKEEVKDTTKTANPVVQLQERFVFPGCKNNIVYSTHSLGRRKTKQRPSQPEEEGGYVTTTLQRRKSSIEAKLADRRRSGGWKVIEVGSSQRRSNSKNLSPDHQRCEGRTEEKHAKGVTPRNIDTQRNKQTTVSESTIVTEKQEAVKVVVKEATSTVRRFTFAGKPTNMFKAAKEKLSRVTSSPPLRRRPSRGHRGNQHRSSNGQVETSTTSSSSSTSPSPAVQEVMVERRVERSESLLSEIMSHRFSNGMEGSQLLESGEHSLVGGKEGGARGEASGATLTADNTPKVMLRRRSERDNDPLPEAKRRSSYLEDDDCSTPKEDFSLSLSEDTVQRGITKTVAETASAKKTHVQRLGSDVTLQQESLEATLTPGGGGASTTGISPPVNVNFRMSYMTAVHDSPQVTYTTTALRDVNQVDYMPFIDEGEGEAISGGNRLQLVSSEPNLLDLDQATMLADSMELDEATISAVTLNNDMFGSRSGSVTSLPETLEDSQTTSTTSLTESFLSPAHTPPVVNLRQSGPSSGGGGRRRNRRRREGNAELDDQTGACLDEMLSSDRLASPATAMSPQCSTSSLSTMSEEMIITLGHSPGTSPPTAFPPTRHAPHLEMETQPCTTRSSRLYPVRRSTVVVQGEKLVIRKLVVAGIVSAEKSYLDCLNVMKEFYRKPLLALTTTSQPILTEREINTIFYRTEDLADLHASLHEKLEPQLRDWNVHTCVGDFFVELCKNLKLYKDYVEFYRQSLKCLEKLKSESLSFKTFLEDVRATVMTHYKDVPRVNELLRRPIERLQSYSLILNDLCQHTPEDHKDYSVLRQSLQAMSLFIASTHDPQSFSKLSGGYNRELVKEGLMVELSEGIRKVRRVFLFHDVIVSSKQKATRAGMKFEPKWFLSLSELSFHPPEESPEAHRPVPATSDMDLNVMRNRIAELKAQIGKENTRESQPEREGSFRKSRGGGIRAIYTMKSSRVERTRKKLQEQQVSYWMAVPSLPLRLYGDTGKQQYIFLLHSEQERENWIASIKKLLPKAVRTVSFQPLELQDLLNHQTITELKKIEEVTLPVLEDEYLSGMLRVRIMSATDISIRTKAAGVYCAVELDEYGKFERKAKTLPVPTDPTTLGVTWDQDFELEVAGAHIVKINICSKQLLKEECYAHGKIRLPIHELRSNKRHKTDITLYPQGSLQIIIEYAASGARDRKPALLSSGVFGVPIEVVSKRERHDIPLIVETCVEEVERRGMSEVGIYRVAGVLRDVRELRDAFDTDYLKAQVIAFEADIHAVAGLLKKYIRELPDPLFTDALYMSFVQGMGLSDPEAREQTLITLLYSLPPVNFKTAIFLFKHLRRVAAGSELNKMNLNNLATLFGPNLLRPAPMGQEESLLNMAAVDVATPVNVLMFFLSCPEEILDEAQMHTSPASTASTGRGRRRDSRKKLTWVEEEDGSSGRVVRTSRRSSGRSSQT